ncbi:MAG: peptide deformylase [Gammaproteobacteria bacterium]|nr:peptide deformylase [Gammaproteobacteria bacterium]MBU2057357.1 peptide deformylase [Gammaproteobacteria bacterium]MBU2175950.1 peptide deformylase [Gammaproteobacteria bacterium]MBU2248921.1 peptide deformylase [Gammaproteobacteria bacterium]MBU2343913.1 peptide deformylase [Gammaproteobacteria bacterium]
MAVSDILTAPDPRLKIKARSVTKSTAVQSFTDDMRETMYSTTKSMGLAAPQVGREFVYL